MQFMEGFAVAQGTSDLNFGGDLDHHAVCLVEGPAII